MLYLQQNTLKKKLMKKLQFFFYDIKIWLDQNYFQPYYIHQMLNQYRDHEVILRLFDKHDQIFLFLKLMYDLKPGVFQQTYGQIWIVIEIRLWKDKQELNAEINKISQILNMLKQSGTKVPVTIYSEKTINSKFRSYLFRDYPNTQFLNSKEQLLHVIDQQIKKRLSQNFYSKNSSSLMQNKQYDSDQSSFSE